MGWRAGGQVGGWVGVGCRVDGTWAHREVRGNRAGAVGSPPCLYIFSIHTLARAEHVMCNRQMHTASIRLSVGMDFFASVHTITPSTSTSMAVHWVAVRHRFQISTVNMPTTTTSRDFSTDCSAGESRRSYTMYVMLFEMQYSSAGTSHSRLWPGVMPKSHAPFSLFSEESLLSSSSALVSYNGTKRWNGAIAKRWHVMHVPWVCMQNVPYGPCTSHAKNAREMISFRRSANVTVIAVE